MSILTTRQLNQIRDLRCAANGGLRKTLADFIHIDTEGIIQMQAQYSRRQIQQHLDTLTYLIDTAVHSQ